MNANEKHEFIVKHCNSIMDDICNKVKDMPKEWDGIELRSYIATKFTEQEKPDLLKGKRFRDYRNKLRVSNL